MNHRLICLLASALFACGKSTKDQSPTTESKVTIAGAPASKPPAGTPPAKAASRGPERAVYSLVDNRLAAHLSRNGGLVVSGATAGFAKYMRFGNQMKGNKKAWDIRQSEGQIKVARLTGKTGSVFLPLTGAQVSAAKVIRMRANAKEAGTVSLRVNENKDINGQLAAGWSTVELAVPAGQLVEGENVLQLFTRSPGVAVSSIEIGAKAPLAEDADLAFYDPAQKALTIPKDGTMSWYVMVPDKAKVTADLADGACTVDVQATAEDGASIDGKLTGTGSAVDLSSLAGKAVRLELGTSGCAKASIANAALVVPGTSPVIKRGEAPKYVLFIIMDSLRADRVRAFNPKARAEAPNFERLAESGTLFLQHFVQGNESQVSHASMWTSMYLAKHKASKMADRLPESYVTIDDVARKVGMFTAGASANGYIRPERGFGTWNKFTNHITERKGLKGVDVIEAGMGFITPKKDQPWLLYLGLIDTHVTWRAKQPWLDKYDPGYTGRFKDSFGDDGPGGFAKDLTDREKDHVRALYDSNVSYQDDLLGKLRAKLEGWGIWDQTMLIITADHGDEQWEDGRVGHAGSQKQTLIHVPLLVHYPKMFPGAKIASGTEGIDILPTIADALGVPHDAEWQGQSLVGLANGANVYPLMATSSQYENYHGGRIGHWKLRLAGAGAPELYNLAKDNGERSNLWGKPGSGIAARLLLDPMWTLRQWNPEWKKSQWGNAAGVSSRFAADLGE